MLGIRFQVLKLLTENLGESVNKEEKGRGTLKETVNKSEEEDGIDDKQRLNDEDYEKRR